MWALLNVVDCFVLAVCYLCCASFAFLILLFVFCFVLLCVCLVRALFVFGLLCAVCVVSLLLASRCFMFLCCVQVCLCVFLFGLDVLIYDVICWDSSLNSSADRVLYIASRLVCGISDPKSVPQTLPPVASRCLPLPPVVV